LAIIVFFSNFVISKILRKWRIFSKTFIKISRIYLFIVLFHFFFIVLLKKATKFVDKKSLLDYHPQSQIQLARAYCLNIVISFFFPVNVATLSYFFPQKMSICITPVSSFWVTKMQKFALKQKHNFFICSFRCWFALSPFVKVHQEPKNIAPRLRKFATNKKKNIAPRLWKFTTNKKKNIAHS
jgi:hypothetical protein